MKVSGLAHMFVATADPPDTKRQVCEKPLGFVEVTENAMVIRCEAGHIADVIRFESEEIALGVAIQYAKRNKVLMRLPQFLDFRSPEAVEHGVSADGVKVWLDPKTCEHINVSRYPSGRVYCDDCGARVPRKSRPFAKFVFEQRRH